MVEFFFPFYVPIAWYHRYVTDVSSLQGFSFEAQQGRLAGSVFATYSTGSTRGISESRDRDHRPQPLAMSQVISEPLTLRRFPVRESHCLGGGEC